MDPKQRLLYAIGLGAAIESVQLLISLGFGFTYRTIDMNDVLFNGIGVYIGFLFYGLLAPIRTKIEQRQPRLGSKGS